MGPKSFSLIEDIRDAADFVPQVVREKSLDDYRTDRLLRQAIERNFEIIGEAAGRLAKQDPTTAEKVEHCSQIVAFRNLLIHGYDMVDDVEVWNIIESHLPLLLGDVTTLLADAD